MKTYYPETVCSIERAAWEMVELSKQSGEVVRAEYNGIELFARYDTPPEALVVYYDMAFKETY